MAAPTVLVVDDEENIAYLVASALRLAELDVATAANGEEALATCTPASPDLVVLDVMLPDLDGFEVLPAAAGQGRRPHRCSSSRRAPTPPTGCAG